MRDCLSGTSPLLLHFRHQPKAMTDNAVLSNRCLGRTNFGEPLDSILVFPADGGCPCGPSLRGDVVRVLVETGGVVGQHQVKVRNVDVRLVPVDQRDSIRDHADIGRAVGVAVNDASLTTD